MNHRSNNSFERLSSSIFLHDTHTVAKQLLGKLLVRTYRGKQLIARICEVESYVGENDKACHAAKGRTKRTEVMYGQAGHTYIYFIYGMYHMLNVVTEAKDFPAAVLIRGAVPIANIDCLTDGPGKLTRAMQITRALNTENLLTSERLYVATDGFQVPEAVIQSTPRIGVDYAGVDALLPWRYLIEPKTIQNASGDSSARPSSVKLGGQ